jgi:molecular chaperone HtpG
LINLIKKEETTILNYQRKSKTSLKTVVGNIVPKRNYSVQPEALDSQSAPFIITQPEFMRRMKEMSLAVVAECSEWAICRKCITVVNTNLR